VNVRENASKFWETAAYLGGQGRERDGTESNKSKKKEEYWEQHAEGNMFKGCVKLSEDPGQPLQD